MKKHYLVFYAAINHGSVSLKHWKDKKKKKKKTLSQSEVKWNPFKRNCLHHLASTNDKRTENISSRPLQVNLQKQESPRVENTPKC